MTDVILLTTQTWNRPSDWTNTNTVSCIGAGAGGANGVPGSVAGGGGAGGSFSSSTNVASFGATVAVTVGAGGAHDSAGGDTYIGGASLGASTVGAQGGPAPSTNTGGTGTSASNVGTTKFAGGNGGNGGSASGQGGGGGGGAGAPSGIGRAGGSGEVGIAAYGAGGGGGAGAGSATAGASVDTSGGTSGGAGGNAQNGTAGGAGGSAGVAGGAGSQGSGGGGGFGNSGSSGSTVGGVGGNGIDLDATHGAGGGGGGGGGLDTTGASNGANGGSYGGAGGGGGYQDGVGGTGGAGIVFISYTPSAFGVLRGTLSGNGASVGTSNNLTGTVAVSIGDLIFCTFGQQTNLTASGVTDGLSNSYSATNAGTDAGTSSGRSFWARASADGTLSTVTVAASSSANDYAGIAAVIGGPIAASPVDANPANASDTTSPFTCPATGTLAQANEIIMAWGTCPTGTTAAWAATSPNLLAGQANNSTNIKATIGYQAVSATSSVAPAFTSGTNPADDTLGTTSFKQASAVTLRGCRGLMPLMGVGCFFWGARKIVENAVRSRRMFLSLRW